MRLAAPLFTAAQRPRRAAGGKKSHYKLYDKIKNIIKEKEKENEIYIYIDVYRYEINDDQRPTPTHQHPPLLKALYSLLYNYPRLRVNTRLTRDPCSISSIHRKNPVKAV